MFGAIGFKNEAFPCLPLPGGFIALERSAEVAHPPALGARGEVAAREMAAIRGEALEGGTASQFQFQPQFILGNVLQGAVHSSPFSRAEPGQLHLQSFLAKGGDVEGVEGYPSVIGRPSVDDCEGEPESVDLAKFTVTLFLVSHAGSIVGVGLDRFTSGFWTRSVERHFSANPRHG